MKDKWVRFLGGPKINVADLTLEQIEEVMDSVKCGEHEFVEGTQAELVERLQIESLIRERGWQ